MASSLSLILSQLLPAINSPKSHRFKSISLTDSFPISSSAFISSSKSHSQIQRFCSVSTTRFSSKKPFTVSDFSSTSGLQALIFDCDGVILESEHLHRQAYNDAFSHLNVRCSASDTKPLNWDSDFYDVLPNQIGGGKPKMRWYFKENGWPIISIFESAPENDSDKAKLIDTLQDWKTERYKEIIKSGTVEPRPGVLRLMDEAKAAGIKGVVCSAATKSSVILCLESLIGNDRFKGLDCFLAGDNVQQKKPDPSIYITAAKRLGVSEKSCMVVEDSIIGLQMYNMEDYNSRKVTQQQQYQDEYDRSLTSDDWYQWMQSSSDGICPVENGKQNSEMNLGITVSENQYYRDDWPEYECNGGHKKMAWDDEFSMNSLLKDDIKVPHISLGGENNGSSARLDKMFDGMVADSQSNCTYQVHET